MLLKRYVIDVRHGDKEHPCTCTEEDMERLCDLLPDEELVRALVAPFIQSQIPLPKDAPIVIRGEAEGPGRGVR